MYPLMFKLDQGANGRGLRCDQEGLFLAGEPLLERDSDNRFCPRPTTEIRKILGGTYRAEPDWTNAKK
jgi:hypothetical protein